jgi:hypothetical protein
MVHSYGFIRFRDSLKRAVARHCGEVTTAHYTNDGLLAILSASVEVEIVTFSYNGQMKRALVVTT